MHRSRCVINKVDAEPLSTDDIAHIQYLQFIICKIKHTTLNTYKKSASRIDLNLSSFMKSCYRLSAKKDISISLAESSIVSGNDLHGTIVINYPGRFDSVVINSQIENSSDVFSYTNLNGKNIKHPYARLSIFKSELGGSTTINFTATTNHVPPAAGEYSNVKFRVSIIQEHKEVVSDIAYIKIIIKKA